ncbi:MAG: glycosyltransferase, partial [Candidatus Dormibacteria bacterium]
LEAMHAGIPVVAHAATAVPETVGDAALLLDTRDPAAVALPARRVLGDPELKASLVKAGHARLEELSLDRTRRMMLDALRQFLDV